MQVVLYNGRNSSSVILLYNDARNSPRLATFTTYYNCSTVSSVVLNSQIIRAIVVLKLVSPRDPFTSMQTKSGLRSIYSIMSILFNKMCLHLCIIIPGLRLHISNYKHSRQHWIKPRTYVQLILNSWKLLCNCGCKGDVSKWSSQKTTS